MKQLLLLALIVLGLGSSLSAQTAPLADSGHFTINQGSHPVGRSDFSIQPTAQSSNSVAGAYSVSSHGTVTLQNTQYSFSGSGSLDPDLGILSENLNGIVNGSAVTFAVHSDGASFAIEISANGRSFRNSLNRPAQAAFFPDFDLASYEVLLELAARHPGATLSALIPKQTGILSVAVLAPQADVPARREGVNVNVHHTSLTIGSVISELYYSLDDRILEVDIPEQAFAMVRDNFQLQQPPPPPAEPATNSERPAATSPPKQ